MEGGIGKAGGGTARPGWREGLRGMFLFQVANSFAEQFGWNFLFLYAARSGLDYNGIALYFLAEFGSCILFIPLARRLDILKAMRWGLVLRIAAFALVLHVAWAGQFYIAGILLGAFVTLFWIPYNTRYLELTSDANRAQASAALFSLFAVLGAVLPVLSGTVIALWGFRPVILVSIAVLAGGLAFSFRLPPAGIMVVDLRATLPCCRRLLPLLACEGLWQGVFWLGVPLGLILRNASSEGYGAFYTMLGLLGGVASLVAGRWSDRQKSRGPLVVGAALSGGAFSLAAALFRADPAAWTLSMGMVYFSTYILFPFTFTVVGERSPDPATAMTVRELVTSIGRVLGGLIVVLSIRLTGGLPLALGAGGLALVGLAGSYMMTRRKGAGRRAQGARPDRRRAKLA
ncbi:MAG: MFS transporter [Euryarchaeota archaeon]|nr:MFS transporter [Euryarchaeota archaeon]